MARTGKPSLEADILVGGQAVLEGVMMRTPHTYSVAVRRPDGEVVVKTERVARWTDLYPVLKWPLIRGGAILIQSLILGLRALNFSAEVALAAAPDSEPVKDPPSKKKTGEQMAMLGTLVFSLAVGIVLFVVVPFWLSGIITKTVFPSASVTAMKDSVHQNWIFFNLVDGAIRLVFFLTYLALVSMMKDIRRVFQYHGAEHKVVNLWEAKEPLEVVNARKYSPLHPRCGTSFLLYVMVVSIVVFTLFKFDVWSLKLASRVVLLPLIAGISYELIRLSARFPKNIVLRIVMAPGLLLQRLTARPPTDEMLEVSLRALREALAVEDQIKKDMAT